MLPTDGFCGVLWCGVGWVGVGWQRLCLFIVVWVLAFLGLLFVHFSE